MEVTPCVQEASSHASSLLANLNLQRERAQFCDCVVRQSPGQLYSAHRCVLAASSPVLASIVSSAGALVELQAPCLSDSVLELLLDYIYTGALPYSRSQQQYYNLLTVACYLQMDELQDTLSAWQQTEVNAADGTSASTGAETQPYEDINNTYSKTANTFHRCLPVSHTYRVNSLETKDHQYSDNVDTRDETRMNSSSIDSCIKDVEIDTCRSSSTNGANHCSRKYASTSSNVSTCCSTPESNGSVSPSQSSFSSSSLSPQPCCGAVPVIRHSSRAAMLQLSEVSTMPPYHPVSQASVSSSSAPYSQSTNDSIVEGITIKHKNHYGAQNQDYRNIKDHIGTQNWDKDSSNQRAIQDLCYISNAGQCDILKQEYSSNTDHDEHIGNGLYHTAHHNDRHAHCDSFWNMNHAKHLREDSVPDSKDRSNSTGGVKYKTDVNFDDFSSKHQRLDCTDCHSVCMAAAAEEQSIHSKDPRFVFSLPVQDSDKGSDSHSEDLCPEGEAKEEISESSRCLAEMDRQDSHCNLYRPETDWHPSLYRAETSRRTHTSSQHDHDSEDKDTAMTDRRCSVDVCQSDSETSSTENTEPHLTFTMPADNNTPDPMNSVVGQSYRGHLHYHCLPQEDAHLSHRDADHKHSHRDHIDQPAAEEEDDGTFASPGQSPLRQHFATGTTDHVLLLDISTKPAQLSYKQRSDEGAKWVAFSQKDTFANGFGQWNEATSVAGLDKRKIRAGTKCGAENIYEADFKSWVGETNVSERKSVDKEQSRPGAEVIHKAGVVEGENQTTTVTVCSPNSVPGSVQASVSSTLTACIPSTLSVSMPTNISPPLSTPLHHPFQCALCDRSFSQRGSLNRHVRSHLGVRPFPCPRCPMTFSRQYRVTEHMRVHQRCVLVTNFQKAPASSV